MLINSNKVKQFVLLFLAIVEAANYTFWYPCFLLRKTFFYLNLSSSKNSLKEMTPSSFLGLPRALYPDEYHQRMKHDIVQGLSAPFACVGSGDPVRVLRLYTTNTLDILWSIYCRDICTTCRYRIYVLCAQALWLWDFLLLIHTLL